MPALQPLNPAEVFALRRTERWVYGGSLAVARALGVWRRPMRAETDLARMRLIDKIYWLHKAQMPMREPANERVRKTFESSGDPYASSRWVGEVEASARLAAAGDLIDHPRLGASAETLYRDAGVRALLFGADLSMANLECVVAARPGDGGFSSRSGPSLAYDDHELDVATGDAAYSFLAAANNHSLDFGEAGVDATIAALDSRGIAHHGLNSRDADPTRPRLLERRGIRFAVVSFTFGLNAHTPPPDRPGIVNRARLDAKACDVDFELLDAQLVAATRAGADFFVAQLHWGMEHEFFPTQNQIEVGHAIAERGVDLIVGHHPHVVQPLEHYRTRRDPRRVVPIAYSLGNVVNPFRATWLRRGAVLDVEVEKRRLLNQHTVTYVSRAALVPIELDADTRSDTLSLKLG
ncbi:MAG: CapA family protein [Polyangiaceae bacterium]